MKTYRLRCVYTGADGETHIHYDKSSTTNLMEWRTQSREMIEGYGGVVKSITIDECEAFKLENWTPL